MVIGVLVRFETDPGASFVEGPIPSSVAERTFASSNCFFFVNVKKYVQRSNVQKATIQQWTH